MRGSLANTPVNLVVMVATSGFLIPRVVIHWCFASTSKATPAKQSKAKPAKQSNAKQIKATQSRTEQIRTKQAKQRKQGNARCGNARQSRSKPSKPKQNDAPQSGADASEAGACSISGFVAFGRPHPAHSEPVPAPTLWAQRFGSSGRMVSCMVRAMSAGGHVSASAKMVVFNARTGIK